MSPFMNTALDLLKSMHIEWTIPHYAAPWSQPAVSQVHR